MCIYVRVIVTVSQFVCVSLTVVCISTCVRSVHVSLCGGDFVLYVFSAAGVRVWKCEPMYVRVFMGQCY